MRLNYYLRAIIILAFFSCVVQAQEQPLSQKQQLSLVPVKIESIPANRLLVGGSVAAHKSVVLSAQMPGRIVSIAGQEGDRFKKGDLLVKINDDELQTQRQAALAQFHTASIAANNASIQHHRQLVSPAVSNRAPGGMGLPGIFDQVFTNRFSDMMGTRDYGVERGADIYAARAQLDQAHQAVQSARSQIQKIDTKLRDTMSIAPFNGVIVTKNIEVGDTVQPGQALLVYEDLDVLEIVVDVPGRMIDKLSEGQIVKARIDGVDDEVAVKVSRIFPTSDPIRHTTRVKFTVPDTKQVSPGNYAEVSIPISKSAEKKRLLIPVTAVVERGGIPSILVVNKQNKVELRLARLGTILPSGEVVVLYGVKENETIIDKPPAFITSGYEIKQ